MKSVIEVSSDLTEDHTAKKITFAFSDFLSSIMDIRGVLLFACLAFPLYVFAYFIKCALERRHYIKLLPSRKVRFFNPFGNAMEGPLLKSSEKGYPAFNALLLEIVCGLSKLFEKEGVFCVWMSFTLFVGLAKSDAVEALLRGSKTIEKAFFYKFTHPLIRTGLLTSSGSKWRHRRKLLTPAFHFDILKDFLTVFNEQAQKLIINLRKEEEKECAEIDTPITLCSLDIMCETIMGVNINAQENSGTEYVKATTRVFMTIMQRIGRILEWSDFLFRFTQNGKRMKLDLQLLHAFNQSVIREKKKELLNKTDSVASAQKRKSFMDILLEHHIQTKTLTEEDIQEEVHTFAAAGHETTAISMCWTLYLIGLYKDVQEKVLEEIDSIFGDDVERPVTIDDLGDMKYLDQVLKECKRLYPAAPCIARQITEDINICGYDIPKGATCFILTYQLHRDKDVFPDPEKFDPDRFSPENCKGRHPYAFIPFSAGPRNCIGQKFALMEEKVVLATILRNFTLHSLDERDKIIPTLGVTLKPDKPFRIKIRPRHTTTM